VGNFSDILDNFSTSPRPCFFLGRRGETFPFCQCSNARPFPCPLQAFILVRAVPYPFSPPDPRIFKGDRIRIPRRVHLFFFRSPDFLPSFINETFGSFQRPLTLLFSFPISSHRVLLLSPPKFERSGFFSQIKVERPFQLLGRSGFFFQRGLHVRAVRLRSHFPLFGTLGSSLFPPSTRTFFFFFVKETKILFFFSSRSLAMSSFLTLIHSCHSPLSSPLRSPFFLRRTSTRVFSPRHDVHSSFPPLLLREEVTHSMRFAFLFGMSFFFPSPARGFSVYFLFLFFQQRRFLKRTSTSSFSVIEARLAASPSVGAASLVLRDGSRRVSSFFPFRFGRRARIFSSMKLCTRVLFFFLVGSPDLFSPPTTPNGSL